MDSPDILEKTELPVDCGDSRSLLQFARENFRRGNFNKSFDIYEKLADLYPKQSVEILAEVYDCYQLLPNKDRYNLYQARSFEFNIKAADKVLDIGSGNIPFPYATHLADLTITDNNYGRAGVPFRHIEGKPVFECDIENMPFKDKEFDFVYCSHVLEHVQNPEKACDELMRVGKRGYIETPTRAKDLIFNAAKVSNHKWHIELVEDVLVFSEYNRRQIEGLNCDILRAMSCDPQTDREKALSAITKLKADKLNTMLLWENSFEYEIQRIKRQQEMRSLVTSCGFNAISNITSGEPRFSFVMIVLNGMPFIEYSLKSVYKFAHEIIIVEGAVEKCMFAANPDGSSTDGTVEFIKSFPDTQNKIKLIQGRWPEKCEMQNEALKYVNGDYVWLIDSDEVYKREDLEKTKEILKANPSITQVNFIPDNFWKGLDHIFVSSEFFKQGCHYRRLFKYVPGAVFTSHRPPTMVWPGSELTTEQMQLIDGDETRKMGIIPYHYSYVLDEQVRQKMELYHRYGWDKGWETDLDEWYQECFLKWTSENREEIEVKYPIWVGDKNSITQLFNGTHPEIMKDFIEKCQKGKMIQTRPTPFVPRNPVVQAQPAVTNPVERFRKRPQYLKIETTNICNANCAFCAYRFMTRPKGVMPMELFKKAIDDYVSIGGGALTISPEVGDLLIDARFLERLRYSRNFDEITDIGFHTNLIALDRWTDEQILEIIRLVDVWCCSIGPNRDVYKDMFGVDKFDHVVANLERLHRLTSISEHKCVVQLNGRAGAEPFNVDERLKKLSVAMLGEPIKNWLRSYADWGGVIEDLPGNTQVNKVEDWKEKRLPCMKPLTSAILFQDGRVGFCGCADFDAKLLIGDVKVEHLGDILGGQKRMQYIESFGTPELNGHCKKCTFYEPLDIELISQWIEGTNPYILNILKHNKKSVDGKKQESPTVVQNSAENAAKEPLPFVSPKPGINETLAQHTGQTQKGICWPEEQALQVIGGTYYQNKVVQAWNLIEVDEPIIKRKNLMAQNIQQNKPFWNIHVALAFLADRLHPENYLEVGTRTGCSLVPVLHNSTIKEAVAVDMWHGSYSGLPNTKEYTVEQINKYRAKTNKQFKIEFIKGDSHKKLKELINSGKKFDLITVDGDHSESGAWEDLQDATKLLADKGAIVFDDIIHPSHSYLRKLVDRFQQEHSEYTVFINSKQDNGCAIFLKNIDPTKLLNEKPSEVPAKVTKGVKVAADYVQTGIKVGAESSFGAKIQDLFSKIRPKKIIETGTYLGTGTTTIITKSLQTLGIDDAMFFTIEVNPQNYARAKKYFETNNIKVNALNGLSVPRAMLPSREEISQKTITDVDYDGIFVDHKEENRVELYYNETNFSNLPDNLLYKCLRLFDFKPDFVLLDSGGHMGNIEFNHLIDNLQGECYIALDDIYHIKHHKSFRQIQSDSRFELVTASKEKFGFCIAKFTPRPTFLKKDVENILWVRTDSIGDGILSSSMLPYVRKRFDGARITVLCQEHVAELYEFCPFIDRIIAVPSEHKWQSQGQYESVIRTIQKTEPGILLNSTYSVHGLSDIKGLEFVPKRLALRHGMGVSYTDIIPTGKKLKPELARHCDFLRGIGVDVCSLEPEMWITSEDEQFADEIFKKYGFEPSRTIALFAGARTGHRLYENYGRALRDICRKSGYTIVALGAEDDYEINQRNLEAAGIFGVNLSGQMTLRQTAAILKCCRLAVGAETALAHIACAVKTPNVILLGGGHFGRFMPYSPLTTAVSLPLECYGCDWQCRYDRVYCVWDVAAEVISEAIRQTLSGPSTKPRVFVQGASLWNVVPGGPRPKAPDKLIDMNSVKVICVESKRQKADRQQLQKV